jgi:hypothetical protein
MTKERHLRRRHKRTEGQEALRGRRGALMKVSMAESAVGVRTTLTKQKSWIRSTRI